MKAPADPNRIYDQILLELELGHVQQATLVLAGTLDGVVASGGDIGSWRQQFCAHPLGTIINASDASEHSPGPSLSLDRGNRGNIQLLQSISDLGVSKALLARAALTVQAVEQAERAGKSVLQAHVELNEMSKFDVIAATDIADGLDGEALGRALVKLRTQLSPGGTILISSLVPNHFGNGWQIVCQGHHPCCHDEQSLESAASFAGFTLTHFRDASNCLVWGVLRDRNKIIQNKGEK